MSARYWHRATSARFCGRCDAPIAAGDVVLAIVLPGVPSARVRCAACVGADTGETAPALPPLATAVDQAAERVAVARAPAAPWTQVVPPSARRWVDTRRAAANDRDDAA